MMLNVRDEKHREWYRDVDFYELIEGYNLFYGCTFVQSFPVIDRLRQQFKHIELILSIGNGRVGDILEHISNPKKQARDIARAGEPLLHALESEEVVLRFPTNKVFHSKYFILQNDETKDFLILNGSMNLTQKAIRDNYEKLTVVARGNLGNLEEVSSYYDWMEEFERDKAETTDYINRKIIPDLYGKSAEEIQKILLGDYQETGVLKDIMQNEEGEEILKLVKEEGKTEEARVNYDLTPEVIEVVETLYTPTGQVRKDRVENLVYKISAAQKKEEEVKEIETDPKWVYDPNRKRVIYDNIEDTNPVTKEDVEKFFENCRILQGQQE